MKPSASRLLEQNIARQRLPIMIETYHQIREDSFRIAWDFLDATGGLDQPDAAAIFLLDNIETTMRRGEYRKLLLSNRAIDAYKRSRQMRRDFALVS